MKKDDYIKTPRFSTVRISEICKSYEIAHKQGFVEPTHYDDLKYDYS